ncbi:MAG TPA: BolA family transcriptional regulator, partial [Aquabacterium sp.]|nr:BolA family transcriptional regulator [Aquabacterium sp.]
MANPTPAAIQQYIAAGLPCTHLEVEGDGQHFFATIVSAEFDGKTRIQ